MSDPLVVEPSERAAAAATRARRPLITRLLPIMIVVVALGGFLGIVGYYYFASSSGGRADGGVAPLVAADPRPYRVKPDNPGGLEVPHQDMGIYNEVARRPAPQATQPERLLPPPETPLPRPGQPIGVPNTTRSTLSEAPPRPPGAPAPPATSVPPAPDVSPPPPSTVTSQMTIPPGATPNAPLPRAPNAPAAAAPPPPQVAAVAPPAPQAAPAPAPQVAPAPLPAARPVPGGVRVAIASVRSEADARREWDRLRRQNPDGLTGVTPDYAQIDLGDRGLYWRIYVGPSESNADAQARCGALKQRKVDCFVARP